MAAQVEIVICILAGGTEGVTTEPAFEALVEDSQGKIDLALYVDDNLTDKNKYANPFWQTRWAEDIHTQAAWGQPSLAHVEVELYQWALLHYPNARRFILTSGDSIPIASVSTFLEQSQKQHSSLNWMGVQFGQYCHSQWKALTRQDAEFVCQQWNASQAMLNTLQANALIPGECPGCCNMVWDECAIGTILVGAGKFQADEARDKRAGEETMVQYPDRITCPVCNLKKARTRAREMPLRALQMLMRRPRDHNNLFARKVSGAVYAELTRVGDPII